jgi:hypothetical protein
MPGFLDFLYVFGNTNGMDPELKFSGFRADIVLTEPRKGLVIDAMNRSGQRFQMCYTLKGLELQGYETDPTSTRDKKWKIRHGTFHHQFDVVKGTQLWILGDQKQTLWNLSAGQLNMSRKYPNSFSTFEQSFKTSLDMHLTYCQWASLDWRWYICTSEDSTHRLVRQVYCILVAAYILTRTQTIGFLDVDTARGISVDPSTLVRVQEEEESVNQILMVLESNADTMERLRDFYKLLVKQGGRFPGDGIRKVSCGDEVQKFASELDEIIHDIQMQATRAKILSKLIKDRKNIVSLIPLILKYMVQRDVPAFAA